MFRKTAAFTFVMAACLFGCLTWQAFAQSHDITDPNCRALQLRVQETVGDEDPDVYRNHGAYVSAVAALVDAQLQAGTIDSACASCITSQFARRVPIADQVPCGPDAVIHNLRGPEVEGCDGPLVGTVTFAINGNDIDVSVSFTSGPLNETLTVFWVCTEVPNGCHETACDYTELGTITTDGSGVGNLNTTLVGGNPYPGKYVHIDIIGTSGVYTHLGGDQIYPGTGATSNKATGTGDPTKQ